MELSPKITKKLNHYFCIRYLFIPTQESETLMVSSLLMVSILLPYSFAFRHKELSEHNLARGKFRQPQPLQGSISLKRKNIVSQYKYRFCNLLFV